MFWRGQRDRTSMNQSLVLVKVRPFCTGKDTIYIDLSLSVKKQQQQHFPFAAQLCHYSQPNVTLNKHQGQGDLSLCGCENTLLKSCLHSLCFRRFYTNLFTVAPPNVATFYMSFFLYYIFESWSLVLVSALAKPKPLQLTLEVLDCGAFQVIRKDDRDSKLCF